jgi:hypothetical protein
LFDHQDVVGKGGQKGLVEGLVENHQFGKA